MLVHDLIQSCAGKWTLTDVNVKLKAVYSHSASIRGDCFQMYDVIAQRANQIEVHLEGPLHQAPIASSDYPLQPKDRVSLVLDDHCDVRSSEDMC